MSLKQQVIDELSGELSLIGNTKSTSLGMANYVDPFSRLEAAQTHDSVKIRGATTRKVNDEDDDLIVVNHR